MFIPSKDLPLSEFRLVQTIFESGSTHDYTIHHSQVDAFIAAQLRLHYEPGVNPHNGSNLTAKLTLIHVAEFSPRGPFWWTTSDLQNNGDPAGAVLFEPDFSSETAVWTRPKQAEVAISEIAAG